MIEQDGNVAITYFQEVPQQVKIGDTTYRFAVHANICMAWVKKEHVQAVLNITRTCCGGNKRHPYREANETQVRRWTNRGGR